MGGAPPKHAPDGVSITYVDACEAAAVLRSMVSNRAAISELPTMSYVVATFVSTGGERLSFETLMFSYNYAPPNLTVSHIHGDTIIYGATGGGGCQPRDVGHLAVCCF